MDKTYLRARYYDTANGSFTQEDPKRDQNNWYSYCGGDPVNHVDPTGEAFFKKLWNGIKTVASKAASAVVSIVKTVGKAITSTVGKEVSAVTSTPKTTTTRTKSNVATSTPVPQASAPVQNNVSNLIHTPSSDATVLKIYTGEPYSENNLAGDFALSAVQEVSTNIMGDVVSAITFASTPIPIRLAQTTTGQLHEIPNISDVADFSMSVGTTFVIGLGAFLDFETQILAGEDPRGAAIKTALHTLVGVGAMALGATLLAPAGVPAAMASIGTFIITFFGNLLVDALYDRFNTYP